MILSSTTASPSVCLVDNPGHPGPDIYAELNQAFLTYGLDVLTDGGFLAFASLHGSRRKHSSAS